MTVSDILIKERRMRLAAERLLEQKQAELFAANRKLGIHAQELTNEIVETRAAVEEIRDENQRVKTDLTAANQRIALTERRLWHSIETIKDGFALFNADDKLIMANNAYLVIFDGMSLIAPGVSYTTILQLLTEEGIVNTGALSPADWRTFMMHRIQEVSPDPVVMQLWNGNHVRLIDQRGPGGDMVSLGHDITDTVLYEEQLKEARSVAESANRAKSSFLANMSHEIRTPMNGVVGMAEVLQDTELTEDQKLYVETIKNSGEALLVIINDVLDYSKIEANKLELHLAPFDLEQAIEETIMLLSPLAQQKGLRILMGRDLSFGHHVIGDPGRIRQVMTNLIGNAVKFTAQGHVVVRTTFAPSQIPDQLRVTITVEDTGVGIPPDMVDHIFGEFNQVENERNRQFDGTGLGLAISKRLVDLMGGKIWVTSKEGTGSCFNIALDMPKSASTKDVATLPNGLRKVVVLAPVGPERDILSIQFEQLGLQVNSGATALEFSNTGDLLLVDHAFAETEGPALLGMNGWQNTRAAIVTYDHNSLLAYAGSLSTAPILRLPLRRETVLTQLSTLFAPDPEMTLPSSERLLKVLAAEDNKTNQLVFRKMIKALNIELIIANNGQEAVTLYQEIQPDLIFMDISMPVMDGKDAARAIRAIEADHERHTPIIAMTAHAMAGDDTEILAAGIDTYLTKPLKKNQIFAQIEQVWTNENADLHIQTATPLNAQVVG